jgi:hypothetical protein
MYAYVCECTHVCVCVCVCTQHVCNERMEKEIAENCRARTYWAMITNLCVDFFGLGVEDSMESVAENDPPENEEDEDEVTEEDDDDEEDDDSDCTPCSKMSSENMDKPKSVSLMCPLCVRRMFSGLRSR